jgi:hypothetical protein
METTNERERDDNGRPLPSLSRSSISAFHSSTLFKLNVVPANFDCLWTFGWQFTIRCRGHGYGHGRFPGVKLVRYVKKTFARVATSDLRKQIASQCDFVVLALAD